MRVEAGSTSAPYSRSPSHCAKARAQAVFAVLAEAEGRVHGVPPESVTFHEVGALDSIVDIVAACLALELLGIDSISAGPVPISEEGPSAHGSIPFPLLPPASCSVDGPPSRAPKPGLVTPTGAALLKALATPGRAPAMTLVAQGYGAGHRDPQDCPNVVRALLGTVQQAVHEPHEDAVIEIAVVDDFGEHIPLIEALLASGALDAVVVPVLMKKGRPAYLVEALRTSRTAPRSSRHCCATAAPLACARRPRCDTSSPAGMPRRLPYGTIRVKVGARGSGCSTRLQSSKTSPLPPVCWRASPGGSQAALRAVDRDALEPQ